MKTSGLGKIKMHVDLQDMCPTRQQLIDMGFNDLEEQNEICKWLQRPEPFVEESLFGRSGAQDESVDMQIPVEGLIEACDKRGIAMPR